MAGQKIEREVDGTKIAVNETVKLGIRPEHVKETIQDADIVLKIDIDVAEHLGGLTYLYGQFKGHKLTIEVSGANLTRSEEHTSELQSRGLIPYAVFCLKKKHNLHV